MSDWISRAAEKKRREEDEARRKAEKLLVEEARRRQYEEEKRVAKQRWFEQNEPQIIVVYQLIEKHVNRAKDAGFQFLSSRRSKDGRTLSFCGDKNRRIEIAPNYEGGFEVMFIIYRLAYDEASDTYYKEKKKKRNYPFDAIPEGKILYWIKWVATGEGSFWLV